MSSYEISDTGLDLIKAWEGIEDGDPTTVPLDPYDDPRGLPTIGWGHLIKEGEDFTGGISLEQAEELLQQDVRWAEKAVLAGLEDVLLQRQFDALVSFTFNVGRQAWYSSTLREVINKDEFNFVPCEMCRWVWSGGETYKGLARRRLAEATMFMYADA